MKIKLTIIITVVLQMKKMKLWEVKQLFQDNTAGQINACLNDCISKYNMNFINTGLREHLLF